MMRYIVSVENTAKGTRMNSYFLAINNCENVVLENLTLVGGLTLGGSNRETPNAGAATNAVARNCNITSRDWYAVCSQMNSTAIIESGTFMENTADTQYKGVLQANFIGDDGPAGSIEVRGGTFTGKINSNNIAYLVIKGGTFSIKPTSYVASGYTATQNGST